LRAVGFTWNEGRRLLANKGIHPWRAAVVAPPRARYGKGELRIIAEREREEGLELLLSYEDYE